MVKEPLCITSGENFNKYYGNKYYSAREKFNAEITSFHERKH